MERRWEIGPQTSREAGNERVCLVQRPGHELGVEAELQLLLEQSEDGSWALKTAQGFLDASKCLRLCQVLHDLGSCPRVLFGGRRIFEKCRFSPYTRSGPLSHIPVSCGSSPGPRAGCPGVGTQNGLSKPPPRCRFGMPRPPPHLPVSSKLRKGLEFIGEI